MQTSTWHERNGIEWNEMKWATRGQKKKVFFMNMYERSLNWYPNCGDPHPHAVRMSRPPKGRSGTILRLMQNAVSSGHPRFLCKLSELGNSTTNWSLFLKKMFCVKVKGTWTLPIRHQSISYPISPSILKRYCNRSSFKWLDDNVTFSSSAYFLRKSVSQFPSSPTLIFFHRNLQACFQSYLTLSWSTLEYFF